MGMQLTFIISYVRKCNNVFIAIVKARSCVIEVWMENSISLVLRKVNKERPKIFQNSDMFKVKCFSLTIHILSKEKKKKIELN